jgi:hypothetical protein
MFLWFLGFFFLLVFSYQIWKLEIADQFLESMNPALGSDQGRVSLIAVGPFAAVMTGLACSVG